MPNFKIVAYLFLGCTYSGGYVHPQNISSVSSELQQKEVRLPEPQPVSIQSDKSFIISKESLDVTFASGDRKRRKAHKLQFHLLIVVKKPK